MAYCAADDISKAISLATLIELTDDEELGTLNQSRVDEAVSQADGVIDSHIGGRYAVPLSSVPGVIKSCSVDISIYNLYSRRVEKMPDVRADRHKNAVKLLEQISKGLVTLGVEAAPSASLESSGSETNKEEDVNVFSREKMVGF